jgi:hypothetical protein
VALTNISGEVNWQQVSLGIGAGTHTLSWRYAKDSSASMGQDAAWVDQVAYTTNAPAITVQPLGKTVNAGSNVQFTVTAIGAGTLSYQWRQNGTTVVGGNSSTLTLNSVGRAQRGAYSVRVTNPGGTTVSSNAVLFVLVPQLFGVPTVLPDGAVLFISGDVDGGSIPPSDLAAFEAQASTNLLNWVTLSNALSVSGGILFLQDPEQTNYPARYYRVLEH